MTESSFSRPVLAVTATVGRLWWRRVVGHIGRVPAYLLVVVLTAAAPAFWLWAWPQIRGPLGDLARSGTGLDGAVLVVLWLSYLLVCAFIRVLMLAFDTVSKDLRTLIFTAPLRPLQRALICVGPDWAASTLLAGLFGSLGVAGFALLNSDFDLVEAVIWMAAAIAVTGALSAAFEAALTAVTGDNDAARAGAAAASLVVVCVLLGSVTQSLIREQTLAGSTIALIGGRILGLPSIASISLGVSGLLLGVAGWMFAASATAKTVFRATARRPLWSSRRGGLFGLSALSFMRDAGNRLAFIGAGAAMLCFFWLDHTLGLGLSAPAALWFACMLAVGSGIVAYGDFAQLRWRVAISPSSGAAVLARWLLGHLAPTVVVCVGVLGLVGFLDLIPVAETLRTMQGTLPTAVLVGLGGGWLAGSLVPYEKDDVLAVATTGLLAAGICAAGWFLCGAVESVTPVPRLAAAFVWLVATFVVSVITRRPRHGAPQGLLAHG